MKLKKIFIIIIVFLIIIGVSCVSCWSYLCCPVSMHNNDIVKVEVPSGTSVKKVAEILKKQNLIRSKTVFYLSARYPFFQHIDIFSHKVYLLSLKSGVYDIKKSSSLGELFKILSSGAQEYVKIIIPEGLTCSKIAKKLEKNNVCSYEDFMKAVTSKELLDLYEIPFQSFEGYLFPDTYFFIPEMDSKEVLKKMVDNFFKKIKEIPETKNISAKRLHDIVVLASIVEREYRVKSEAPLIASVFTNRLKRHIGLYSCATIAYIITEIQGKPHPDIITYNDLQIDSPYNTYKWAGLPPGPISNPGIVALSAAANPPKTNYYYFRLTDAKRGTHSFSTTFKSHISKGHRLYTKSSVDN